MNELRNADRLDLLLTYVKIVETGSLSAAARQLGTTQPTISRRLQWLERTLGLRLLQRSTHALKMTEAGERCLEHARALIEHWQAMSAELRGERDLPSGLLRVQVPHAFGQEQLIGPLAGYLRQHAGVQVEWLLHDRQPDFVAGGIDCAIRVGTISDPTVVALRLAEVPRSVYAAPSLWGAGAASDEPAALAALPWLALHTYYRNEVVLQHETSGALARFEITPRFSTDSLHALRQAARAGLGACIASAWVMAEDVAQGRLQHLLPDWRAPALPVHLVYPPAHVLPARLRAFIEAMREAMPGLSGMRPPTRSSALPPGGYPPAG